MSPIIIFLICRWSYAQRTLRGVSLKFCPTLKNVLLEMMCATTTKQSLRVSEPKVNFCTVRVVAMGTDSLSLSNGLSMHGAQFLHSLANTHNHLSFELNLSATESALTIVPHYRPMSSHDAKTLRVC